MCKVFLLEDDEAISDIVVYLLEDAGFDISARSTIAEFNKLFDSSYPDLVILDMMLPDGSGIDVCQQLKGSAVTCEIPVMLMTAHFNGHNLAKTVAVDEFISKPFDINLLLEKVNAWLLK